MRNDLKIEGPGRERGIPKLLSLLGFIVEGV